MNRIFIGIQILIYLTCHAIIHGQVNTHVLDSFKNKLAHLRGIEKIDALNHFTSNPISGIENEQMYYAYFAFSLSKKNHYQIGQIKSSINLAGLYEAKQNHDLAIKYYKESLKISRTSKHLNELSSAYISLSNICLSKYDYLSAFLYSVNSIPALVLLKKDDQFKNGLQKIRSLPINPVLYINYYRSIEKQLIDSKNYEYLVYFYANFAALYIYTADFEKAFQMACNRLKMSRKINSLVNIGKAYTQMAAAKIYVHDTLAVKTYCDSALQLVDSLPISKDKGFLYYNIANIEYYFSNTYKAILYYSLCKEILIKVGEHSFINNLNYNLAFLYANLNRFDLVNDLVCDTLSADKNQFYTLFASTGLNQHEKAIYISKRIIKHGSQTLNLAELYFLLGKNYFYINKMDSAIYFLSKSKAIKDSTSYTSYFNYYLLAPELFLAKYFMQNRNFSKSIEFANQSLEIAKKYSDRKLECETYLVLSNGLESIGRNNEAYLSLKKYLKLKQEIERLDAQNQLQFNEIQNLKITNEFNRKSLRKDLELKEKTIHSKNIITTILIISLIIILTLLFVLFQNFQQKKKDNETLSEQKLDIEEKSHILENLNHEISAQRDILYKQNKDITDSINYACIIQQALLSNKEVLDNAAIENFIFYKPRDIISGDFYWFKKIGDYVYFTAADCTGHGVPGAFMSVLGISLLNEITESNDIIPPAFVLNELRDKLKRSLKQDKSNASTYDGIDISLCLFDMSTLELQYAGAFNSLFLFRNNQLKEYIADKMPVGTHPLDFNKFTNHQIQLEKNDRIYLFTDGYLSQFGGPELKKLNYSRFKKILQELQVQPFSVHNKLLEQYLNEWQANNPQIDDVLIIGIQI